MFIVENAKILRQLGLVGRNCGTQHVQLNTRKVYQRFVRAYYSITSTQKLTDLLMKASGSVRKRHPALLCQIDDVSPSISEVTDSGTKIQIQPVDISATLSERFVRCPLLHFTHTFLACDVTSACWSLGQARLQ